MAIGADDAIGVQEVDIRGGTTRDRIPRPGGTIARGTTRPWHRCRFGQGFIGFAAKEGLVEEPVSPKRHVSIVKRMDPRVSQDPNRLDAVVARPIGKGARGLVKCRTRVVRG